MGDNGVAPLEGGSGSPSRVTADWDCLLYILAFSFIPVLKIPLSLSDAIPNASFFRMLNGRKKRRVWYLSHFQATKKAKSSLFECAASPELSLFTLNESEKNREIWY